MERGEKTGLPRDFCKVFWKVAKRFEDNIEMNFNENASTCVRRISLAQDILNCMAVKIFVGLLQLRGLLR